MSLYGRLGLRDPWHFAGDPGALRRARRGETAGPWWDPPVVRPGTVRASGLMEVYGTSRSAGAVTPALGSPGRAGRKVEALHWNFGNAGADRRFEGPCSTSLSSLKAPARRKRRASRKPKEGRELGRVRVLTPPPPLTRTGRDGERRGASPTPNPRPNGNYCDPPPFQKNQGPQLADLV